MDNAWFSVRKLINPGTFTGAIALAILMIILAWIACVVTSNLLRKTNWITWKVRIKIDETVIHYIIRVKNLLIVLCAVFIYASFVPGLRALFGTMIAGAGITAMIVGFAAKSTMANLISGLSLAL